MEVAMIILAAGHGTRMHSKLPKVLHPILGKPIVLYSLETATKLTGGKPYLVIGHDAERVRQAVGDAAEFVLQEPQLGTGHAVQQSETHLRGAADLVLVLTADMPLIRERTLQKLIEVHRQSNAPITMLTVQVDDPRGFGRVVRDGVDGRVLAIVEEAQATEEQLALRELNASVYCFDASWLWSALSRIPLSPKGEYYLTDLVGIAVSDGKDVQAIRVEDVSEMIGINTRQDLIDAQRILQTRINTEWMLNGVTIYDPGTTYIEPGVRIGRDTVVWPNTYLQGDTVIGEDCVVGPNTIMRDSVAGNGCKIFASVLEYARLENYVDIGPFARLRKGAHLADHVHMGNFGEVKNSYLGVGTKMGHFSYLGDATIGRDVNIGAGTITCNYDGRSKHPTEIGDDAFIGSDTMLVAPLKLGEGAVTGAGSVVTKNVPAYSLAVGAPARAIKKLEKRD